LLILLVLIIVLLIAVSVLLVLILILVILLVLVLIVVLHTYTISLLFYGICRNSSIAEKAFGYTQREMRFFLKKQILTQLYTSNHYKHRKNHIPYHDHFVIRDVMGHAMLILVFPIRQTP